MRTAIVTATILALSAPARAADSTVPLFPELDEASCNRLSDIWWKLEEQLEGIRDCHTDKCERARNQGRALQVKVEIIWAQGSCDRFRPISTPSPVARDAGAVR